MNTAKIRSSDLFYHPEPSLNKAGARGLRKVHERLNFLLRFCDCSQKTVADLGCSGGFFSFALASRAKRVIGFDANEALIARNAEQAKARGIDNVEFRTALISPEFLSSEEMPQVDLTIFLSVLHHIIIPTESYDYAAKDDRGVEHGRAILKAVRSKTQTLAFEMGQSNESYAWAKRLPPMLPNPGVWIRDNLLVPAGFNHVRVFSPPVWHGVRGLKHRVMHGIVTRLPRMEGLARRWANYDTRDARYFFIAE